VSEFMLALCEDIQHPISSPMPNAFGSGHYRTGASIACWPPPGDLKVQ